MSIQVSPALANDADATVSEALRLWNTIGKPNVMIKVPATDDGVLAIWGGDPHSIAAPAGLECARSAGGVRGWET